MDGVLAWYKEASLAELNQRGYFRNLRPYRSTIEAVKELLKNGIDIHILSAVLPNPIARNEKHDWIREHLPELSDEKIIFTPCGKKKSDYVPDLGPDDYLLDDHSPNLISFVEAGGNAIKALNQLNGKGEKFKGPRVNILSNPHLADEIVRIIETGRP